MRYTIMDKDQFRECSTGEVLNSLKSRADGLTDSEAASRLAIYGFNEIAEKKKSRILKFISKFYGPIPALLWVIMALFYFLGNWADLCLISALLVFNAIVSFAMEDKADTSITLLKQRLSTNSRVCRSGSWNVVHSKMLVPGDIIRLRPGDIIPADAKVITGDNLGIDQSGVTGESLPVSRSAGNLVYSGTVLQKGEATCVVILTGYQTLYGETAKLVETAKPKSHLQSEILSIVKYLVAADLVIITLLFIYCYGFLHMALPALIVFLLVVFISSVPMALPASFTVSLAFGAEKLSKKSILVTKLSAIEGTATMDLLCMDKTGTITENRIKVATVFGFGTGQEEVIRYAAEASSDENKDPIDTAILEYANTLHVKSGSQLSFVPFDSSTKMTEAQVQEGDETYSVAKGAANIISVLCGISADQTQALNEKVTGFALKGYRTIAVAKNAGTWEIVGVIALYDRPRPDSGKLIEKLHDLGISIKMITGDNRAVAVQIAREVGLGTNIVDIHSGDFDKDDNLVKTITDADGFSGIYPKDKYTIVKAMQDHGFIVGMTGDGVNDAPALKQADVGIAVESATDVAKSAADIVLTKNGIEVIVDAVKESRRIFERMLIYTIVKLAKVIQQLAFITIIFVVYGFIPITAFLLILLTFTNDIVNLSISTDNVGFSKNPDFWDMKYIMPMAALLGGLLTIQALLLVPVGLGVFGLSVPGLATAAFLMLNISDKVTIFNVRERGWAFKSMPSIAVIAASLGGVLAGIVFAYYGIFMDRISLPVILWIVAMSIAFFVIADILKVWLNNRITVAHPKCAAPAYAME
jgi:H+-transporting ATPase